MWRAIGTTTRCYCLFIWWLWHEANLPLRRGQISFSLQSASSLIQRPSSTRTLVTSAIQYTLLRHFHTVPNRTNSIPVSRRLRTLHQMMPPSLPPFWHVATLLPFILLLLGLHNWIKVINDQYLTGLVSLTECFHLSTPIPAFASSIRVWFTLTTNFATRTVYSIMGRVECSSLENIRNKLQVIDTRLDIILVCLNTSIPINISHWRLCIRTQ